MKIRIILILFLSILSSYCLGQNSPLYTQYIFDPYLINPSLLTRNNQSELNLLYRQQWTSIQDGPQTISFNYQQPVNSKMSLGVNIIDDKTVLLSNTSMLATFGYKVALATDHTIGFGLSFGFFSNRLRTEDIPDIDANDPAILNALSNSFAFNSQFGINYTYKNLMIGLSLTELIDNQAFSSEQFQKPIFDQLNNRNILMSYIFNLSSNFDLQPFFMYRFNRNELNFFEASAFLSYKKLIGLGAGYRENFGPMTYLRTTIKKIEIGYAYDFPSVKYSVSLGGTHEIQLKYRFGKLVEVPIKKNKKSTSYVPETQKNKITTEEKPIIEEISNDNNKVIIEKPVTEVVTADEKPAEEIQPILEQKVDDSNEGNFYLIVGSYKFKSNADQLVRTLNQDGHKTGIIYSEETKLYYVHIPTYRTNEISIEKVEQIRNSTKFKEAWYLEFINK